jgi:phospholipase/carboxylesterase
VEDFRQAVESLARLLDPVYLPKADLSRVYLTGFSEGAALAYTFGILKPVNIIAIAGLSGFAPEDMSTYIENKPLSGKNIFVTHGTRDRLVPVLKARQAVMQLEAAGGTVSYCEDDVGHKLSASCFRSLEVFYTEQIK